MKILIFVEMFWKCFFGFQSQNIQFEPGFQKSETVRKHLDIGGDNGLNGNPRTFGGKPCMEKYQ